MHLELKTEIHNAKWAERMSRIAAQNTLVEMLFSITDTYNEAHEGQLNMQSSLTAQRQELQDRMQELQRQREQLLQERLQLKRIKSGIKTNVSEHLDNLYSLLGYRMTDCQDFGNEGAKQVTLHYNDYCFIKFIKFSVGENYDLLHIQPEHPNFAQIKQFLRDTHDLPGLLSNVQKYFALIVGLKREAA